MRDASYAVPVKLWALCCAFAGSTFAGDAVRTWVMTLFALLYLATQRNWRLFRSYGVFYLALAGLLVGMRRFGLKMVFFSEFHVLLFWVLSPVALVAWDLITTPPGEISAFLSRLHAPTPIILGMLVVFRFLPTFRGELKNVTRSMRGRGLADPKRLLLRPVETFEYMLVPLLLRCLQISDQLAVSAVARGAERPGVRGSYFGKPIGIRDRGMILLWTVVTAAFLIISRQNA